MKKMKKLFFVLLVLAIVTSLLTSWFFKKKKQKVETKYKIGIVFDIGGKGDKSFNDSAYEGLRRIAKDYKGYIKDDPDNVDFGKEIELKYLEPKSGGQDRELLLRVLAEEGYDLVVGVGFMFGDSIGKVAKDFPDVHFAIIDGFIPDLNADSNITCLGFAEHEGSFLVGAIAGMLTKSNKVGFIGGMDIPLIHKFQGGFLAGAMYVNPELRKDGNLVGQYIGKDPTAFNDPKTAESIALNMFNQGADIIYHAAGGSGTGLFKAAKDTGNYAIGVDSDQGLVLASSDSAETKALANHIYTSMLKRVDTGIYLTSKTLIETGKVDGGYKTFTLADDGVGYAVNDFNKDQLLGIQGKIDEIKQKIVKGEVVVPDHDSKVADWAAQNLK
ncbi:MAG: BMP family ABC transporter substrate-binding protein [Spirochaetes bacterium]|nr:BMP family ABC transporter substrate-binding protein [Spirochaetota bacterium]